MRVTGTIGAVLMAAMLSTTVLAADPPAGGKRGPIEVPPELYVNQQAGVDPAAVIEQARELRQRADQGDADATYQFALLLAYFMSGRGHLDGEQAAELRKLSDAKPVSGWMMKAAEAGSQPAIEVICGMGEDPLAPADLREKGKGRCPELRAKHPKMGSDPIS